MREIGSRAMGTFWDDGNILDSDGSINPVYTYIKSYQTVHLKWLNFSEYKLPQ